MTMNRIIERFNQLKAARTKGLIVYIGAADPDLAATLQLAVAFDEAGVDVLELGVPFSDPLADGPVNQLAAQRGLAAGATPRKVLETIAEVRKRSQIPIVLYIYFNLIHRHGLREFIDESARAGVDGLLVLDLPPEEAENYDALMQAADLCPIYLVAPTTPDDRIALIVKHAAGFVYYVSREGVTGMQQKIADSLGAGIARIRALTALPVAVGFGISDSDQARAAAAHADAVVVGSAVVNRIAKGGRNHDLVPRVAEFVKSLVTAVKSANLDAPVPTARGEGRQP
jgi:tryptophan synthase alpha chain